MLQKEQVIHNNVQLPGVVEGVFDEEICEPAPLLQDHGDPVAYHNIWAVRLPLKGS